jgi:predicted CXXCH cytochrome family protein
VRFGLMGCSDCHSAHGSTTVAMLNKPTLNQTCFSCHAEKRGPLLWEHQPVTEDCSLCHTAHGSVRNALLNKSPPLLCQQCHAPAGHPSFGLTSKSLPGGGAGGSIYLVAGGCTNCHSQVHGSNHPRVEAAAMTMKIFSSPHLLAALGVLGAATAASAQVDTSQWKCASCPVPKGTSGSVDAGVGYVTESSEKFGDYTGLDKKGAVRDPRRHA